VKAIVIAALASWLAAALAVPPAMQHVIDGGETLDYDLTWLGMSGGAARMTIGPLAAGEIRMTSIAGSSSGFSRIYKVRDEIETVVTRTSFSTIRYHKKFREGSRKKDETTLIAEGVATRKGKQRPVPTPVFDPLSMIYYLRMVNLAAGPQRFTVYADGKTYAVDVAIARRETITVPAGRFRTVVIEPKMQAGGLFRDEDSQLTIWFSDDERRLPVRIRSEVKIGTITASLRRVSAGSANPEPLSK
jgi:hypothetical protein